MRCFFGFSNLRMSKHILLLFSLVILNLSMPLYGQIYEVGAYGGISGYRGDLNQTKLFNKTHGAGGLMLRYSHNQHVAARLNIGYTVLRGNDVRKYNPYFIFPERNSKYSFETTVAEASLQGEVNFLHFIVGNADTRFTPYIFGGGGGIYFNPKVYRNNIRYNETGHLEEDPQESEQAKENFALISLVGFGVKLNVVRDIVVDAAWGFRFSNTDYLDQVGLRGNPKDDDYYSIISLTVTYKFLDRSRARCPMHHLPN